MPTLSVIKNKDLEVKKKSLSISYLNFLFQNHRLDENKDLNMKALECRLQHCFSNAEFCGEKISLNSRSNRESINIM